MQKLRGYLALGIFIMGIVSLLCLLLPLIEITDDALLLMMLAVPPLICGLIIALPIVISITQGFTSILKAKS